MRLRQELDNFEKLENEAVSKAKECLKVTSYLKIMILTLNCEDQNLKIYFKINFKVYKAL